MLGGAHSFDAWSHPISDTYLIRCIVSLIADRICISIVDVCVIMLIYIVQPQYLLLKIGHY